MDLQSILNQAALETTENEDLEYRPKSRERLYSNDVEPKSIKELLKEAASEVRNDDDRQAEKAFRQETDILKKQVDFDSETRGFIDKLNESNYSQDFDMRDDTNEEINHVEPEKPQEIKKNDTVPKVKLKFVEEDHDSYDSDASNESEIEEYEEEGKKEIEIFNKALLVSACRGDRKNLDLAFEMGAFFFAKDRHGWTGLHWAAAINNPEILNIFIEKAERRMKKPLRFIDSTDQISGWTALHVACSKGHSEIVRILVKHKASVKKKNIFHEIPVDLWTDRESPAGEDILKLLGE